MVMENCLEALKATKKEFGGSMSIGIGTVKNLNAARAAIDFGADFIVSPCQVKDVKEVVKKSNLPYIPGAMTPREVYDSYAEGAEVIKLFPGGVMGAEFISALKAPFPDIPLMPDGGVSLSNARELFLAGSDALGVGSALTPKELVESGEYEEITKIAEKFLKIARESRSINK
jgi:2-dehydro-3-deoxyphosphogluconate aldolase/(4S)-4-hydroxy-2-oxoglutarate aldolase